MVRTKGVAPLIYEIPGGGGEVEDKGLITTVVRETKEETRLDVVRILKTFDAFEYVTRKGPAIQFNFLVEVKDGLEGHVQLNLSEHEGWWPIPWFEQLCWRESYGRRNQTTGTKVLSRTALEWSDCSKRWGATSTL